MNEEQVGKSGGEGAGNQRDGEGGQHGQSGGSVSGSGVGEATSAEVPASSELSIRERRQQREVRYARQQRAQQENAARVAELAKEGPTRLAVRIVDKLESLTELLIEHNPGATCDEAPRSEWIADLIELALLGRALLPQIEPMDRLALVNKRGPPPHVWPHEEISATSAHGAVAVAVPYLLFNVLGVDPLHQASCERTLAAPPSRWDAMADRAERLGMVGRAALMQALNEERLLAAPAPEVLAAGHDRTRANRGSGTLAPGPGQRRPRKPSLIKRNDSKLLARLLQAKVAGFTQGELDWMHSRWAFEVKCHVKRIGPSAGLTPFFCKWLERFRVSPRAPASDELRADLVKITEKGGKQTKALFNGILG